ncbi:hypothetical protein Tco_1234379 [Tanacetum coccineum]
MSNQTNELKNMMASFFQMNTASTSGSGSLPSNTVANPRGELKAITTQSGLVLDGPSVSMPPLFINPEEDERVEETLMDPELTEYTIKVLPPLVQKAKPTSLNNYVVHQRDPLHPNIPYPSRMHQEKQQEKDEDLFANEKTTNHQSGNPTFSSHTDLTSPEVINPLSGNPNPILEPVTKSSSSFTITSFEESDLIWEEFEAYLASDSFPPGNDDLPFDIESDLREIEYLLNHDPTKEMDSILEDSVDEGNLVNPNNDLVDTIPEMFTDEHTLDYSSPPLYDDVNDDLVELESNNNDFYDDPFDSKEDKIKESQLLIDEFNPPRLSDFLPSPECDSVLYEDFSEVDALPSTNNKDKVFNPGILIHENLFEVTIRVTPDKNEKKISISNASLILEDFNPPIYNFLSTKKFLGLKLYSRFHPKMRKKFSTPGFSLLKEFILLFSQNYLIGTLKLSKSLIFLKAR